MALSLSNKSLSMTPSQGGFLLVELLVSIAIATVLLGAFITLVMNSVKAGNANAEELTAELYLREEIEVAKDLEFSKDWSELKSCTATNVCYPKASSGVWHLAHPLGGQTGEQIQSKYNRFLFTEDTTDPKTRKVTAQIEWPINNPMHKRILETYIYNPNLP